MNNKAQNVGKIRKSVIDPYVGNFGEFALI